MADHRKLSLKATPTPWWPWRNTKVCAGQSRVDSEIPSWCAFTAVAPAVRFSALEILATPIFFLARDLNSRKSEAVHERRVGFFLLAGIIGSLLRERGFYHSRRAWQWLKVAQLRVRNASTSHTRTGTQRAKGEGGAGTTGKASQFSGAKMAVLKWRC